MKVLVVEDSKVQRALLTDALGSFGYACLQAGDGEEGLRLFTSEQPDIIISDLEMPRMNGLELCRRVRRQHTAAGSYPYFIFLSTHKDLDSVVEGMKAGADDYLGKPVDVRQLEACLIAARRVTTLHRELASYSQQLETLNEKLYQQSRRDPLTDIWNRLKLQEDLKEFEDRSSRYEARYCLALLDVDHFKKYNDNYGHGAGDETLKRVATVLSQGVRASDRVYRYGGEEFVVVFCEQTLETSFRALDRLRVLIEEERMEHAFNGSGVVTVSCGLASLGSEALDSEACLQQADEALYLAKEQGRNRIVAYPSGGGGTTEFNTGPRR